MPEMKDGCVKPARGPIRPAAESGHASGAIPPAGTDRQQGVPVMQARVDITPGMQPVRRLIVQRRFL